MNKQELLAFLLEHISYFTNVSSEDFTLLTNLDSSELGLVDGNNYQIISLIKQIADYALVKEVLSDEQIMELRNYLPDDNGNMLYDVLDIIDKCDQYMNILYKEDCHHPSVTNYMNLSIGSALYDVMLETISDLILYTNGRFQDDLIDLGNIIDDKVVEIPELLFAQIEEMVENGSICSSYKLLLYLSNYAKNFLMIKFGFPVIPMESEIHNQTYYIDDWYINIKKEAKLYSTVNIKVSHFLECYALILKKASKYKEYSDDAKVISLIQDLEEGYYLYESYKYRFIKDDYREQKILEKCKKM